MLVVPGSAFASTNEGAKREPRIIQRHNPHHARTLTKHRPRCRTLTCDRRVDRIWAIHHPAISAHEACIIQHESGGDPNAVSGIYSGIGQWEQSRWESDGGMRYAPTPTSATYAEQEKVLRGEGDAGMSEQQGQYDGCG